MTEEEELEAAEKELEAALKANPRMVKIYEVNGEYVELSGDAVRLLEHAHTKHARGKDAKRDPQTDRLFEFYKQQRPLHDLKKDALEAALKLGVKDRLFPHYSDLLDDELPITHKTLHIRFKYKHGKDYDKLI